MDDIGVRITVLVLLAATGAILIWMAGAGASGRLRRNQLVGIRIPSTMASEEAWRVAHVRAKRPTMWGGIAAVAAGLCAFLPLPTESLSFVVLGGAAVILACVLYGAWVGGRAAREAAERHR